jgi:methionine-S-sulfoxide reductase
VEAESGYMGGRTKDPTYRDVCSHETGHAEVVKVVYDPAKVGYGDLLAWFFKIHDPTQLNRQGPDVGDNYRSAIYGTPEQIEAARKFVEEQGKTARFAGKKIVTELRTLEQAGKYYPAEEYHQDYHAKHGGSCPLPEG